MFNIGSGEMLVIFLLALIVLGPERLPKAMGQVGRAVAQMRKLSSGFQDEIRRAMDPIDAPFRPGEETLAGPVPSATDEVKVVNIGKGDGAGTSGTGTTPGQASATAQGGTAGLDPELAPTSRPTPVVVEKPAAPVTPVRPRPAADGAVADGAVADDRAAG